MHPNLQTLALSSGWRLEHSAVRGTTLTRRLPQRRGVVCALRTVDNLGTPERESQPARLFFILAKDWYDETKSHLTPVLKMDGKASALMAVVDRNPLQFTLSIRRSKGGTCARCGEPWSGGGRCADCERSYGPDRSRNAQ